MQERFKESRLSRAEPRRCVRTGNEHYRPPSSMHCGSRSGHDARLQPSGFPQSRTVAVLLFHASAARTYHSCGKPQSKMITQSDQTWTYVSQQQPRDSSGAHAGTTYSPLRWGETLLNPGLLLLLSVLLLLPTDGQVAPSACAPACPT